MEPAIANLEFDASGWRWLYELWPDKLVATGVNGEERQHFEFELKHAHDIPNRGVTTLGVRCPTRLVIWTAAAMAATVLSFGAVFLLVTDRFPPFRHARDFIWLAIALLFLELSAAILLPYLLRIRNFQRYVTFKRLSDGGELLTLHSNMNPSDDAFERFVEEVSVAIRMQRLGETPSDYSFKAYDDHSGA